MGSGLIPLSAHCREETPLISGRVTSAAATEPQVQARAPRSWGAMLAGFLSTEYNGFGEHLCYQRSIPEVE